MRFVGVINQFGHVVAGGFRNDVLSYVNNGRELMMYMRIVLDMNMRKDFDDALDHVNYLHSQRDKVSMISIPMGKHIVVPTTETDVDVPKTVSRAKNEFLDLKIIAANLKPIAEIL